MSKMLLLFSHTVTPVQVADAAANWQVREFVTMPESLQKMWQAVPADNISVIEYAIPFRNWIRDSYAPGDLVLLQGDFGCTFSLAEWCIRNGINAVYSTTARSHFEEQLPDGTIRSTKDFKHVLFRPYEIITN